MHPFNRDDVDPSVTDDEIAQAIDGTATAYTGLDVNEQDDPDDDVHLLAGPVAASIPQRIANARQLRDNHVNVGVNHCLATVRGPILGLPVLYPTAALAGRNSKPWHPVAAPGSTAVPRGSIGFAFNGGAGHVWLELGGGLVSTTDFHEPGFEGVALRSRMLTWCSADSWGWGESVNGFDVWPDPKAATDKPPAPKPWTWEDRLKQMHRDLRRARDNDAPKRHIDGLKTWIDKIEAKHK